MQVKQTIEIDAPLDAVWDKISDLVGIKNWTSTVTEAHYHTETQRGLGAGRTCEVKGLGTLVENVLEWNEGESYRLSLEGLPFFIREASGGWRLEKVDADHTRATTFIDMETGFWPVGPLMERFMLGPQMTKTIKLVQSEFKRSLRRERASKVA